MAPDAAACGHPTQDGGPCRNRVIGGPNARCFRHAGVPTTPAEQEASRKNATSHGYFVSGFLDDEERALFDHVVRTGVLPPELRLHTVGALVVRAARMMRWEAGGKEVSGYTTAALDKLHRALESTPPGEVKVTHAWDTAEVERQVNAVLRDREVLVRRLPAKVQDAVRAAFREQDG